MEDLKFRTLKAGEVEARIDQVKQNGVTLLLYKDARVDMRILDETVGAFGWQREHTEHKGNLFCKIGIFRKDTGVWIWKEDCGTESYTEKEKGEASDSFKRAGFCWGIGRELYTAPFIFVPADKCSIQTNQAGKQTCYDRFVVSDLEVKDGTITAVKIWNSTRHAPAYEWKMTAYAAPAANAENEAKKTACVAKDEKTKEKTQPQQITRDEAMKEKADDGTLLVDLFKSRDKAKLDAIKKNGSDRTKAAVAVLEEWIKEINEAKK